MAFKTFFGLYEHTVMPFGSSNRTFGLPTFINSLLAPFIDLFVFTYLDDIIIFWGEHSRHIH